jgi:hypothetical protein
MFEEESAIAVGWCGVGSKGVKGQWIYRQRKLVGLWHDQAAIGRLARVYVGAKEAAAKLRSRGSYRIASQQILHVQVESCRGVCAWIEFGRMTRAVVA